MKRGVFRSTTLSTGTELCYEARSLQLAGQQALRETRDMRK